MQLPCDLVLTVLGISQQKWELSSHKSLCTSVYSRFMQSSPKLDTTPMPFSVWMSRAAWGLALPHSYLECVYLSREWVRYVLRDWGRAVLAHQQNWVGYILSWISKAFGFPDLLPLEAVSKQGLPPQDSLLGLLRGMCFLLRHGCALSSLLLHWEQPVNNLMGEITHCLEHHFWYGFMGAYVPCVCM